jgi:CMP-N,N'-diacetyllegionaminic acid synthase
MYKGKRFLGVIPARKGSKGIPKKNMYKVNGKPLIEYTIDVALRARFLDQIFVSTDWMDIVYLSKRKGLSIPFLRPPELATDEARIIDVLIHVVDEWKKRNQYFDYIVLLQPTQPLRKSDHIDEAIQQIVDLNHHSLVSVSRVTDHPILIRRINESGELENLLNVSSTIRRQDMPPYYKINGLIYINKLDHHFNSNTSLNDNKLPFITDPKYDLDIDLIEDIHWFEERLKLF